MSPVKLGSLATYVIIFEHIIALYSKSVSDDIFLMLSPFSCCFCNDDITSCLWDIKKVYCCILFFLLIWFVPKYSQAISIQICFLLFSKPKCFQRMEDNFCLSTGSPLDPSLDLGRPPPTILTVADSHLYMVLKSFPCCSFTGSQLLSRISLVLLLLK